MKSKGVAKLAARRAQVVLIFRGSELQLRHNSSLRAALSFALALSPKASPHLGGQQVVACLRRGGTAHERISACVGLWFWALAGTWDATAARTFAALPRACRGRRCARRGAIRVSSGAA